MSKQDDTIRLKHMLDYGREVIEFTEGHSADDLEDNRLLERALCYSIGVIGEAASKISAELRQQTPHIPWADIVGMRNFLFHAYFRVEATILWNTATHSVPQLVKQLEELLQE